MTFFTLERIGIIDGYFTGGIVMENNGLKWFEKKWFVNLKIRARLNFSFLLVAILAVIMGAAGIVLAL